MDGVRIVGEDFDDEEETVVAPPPEPKPEPEPEVEPEDDEFDMVEELDTDMLEVGDVDLEETLGAEDQGAVDDILDLPDDAIDIDPATDDDD